MLEINIFIWKIIVYKILNYWKILILRVFFNFSKLIFIVININEGIEVGFVFG